MAVPHLEEIARFASERRYRPATVERWLRLDATDAKALFGLASELRLGENQLRDLWEWAAEIAARDGSSIASVFASEAITSSRLRDAGRNDKLKSIKEALRRLRFPQLAAVERRLNELIGTLDLPRGMRAALPAFLEGDTVRFEFEAGSPARLKEVAEALERIAGSDAFAQIVRLLEEAP